MVRGLLPGFDLPQLHPRIQGGAALFCERMVGDYYNVMGLPVCRLGQTLRSVAPEVMEDML